MQRVVCPLCKTGFEANISRDNVAVNCLACGVAFNAASFLSKDDFAAKAAPPVRKPEACATPARSEPASPSTRTAGLSFMTDSKAPAPACGAGVPPASGPRPADKLREQLHDLRKQFQARAVDQAAKILVDSKAAPQPVPACDTPKNGAAEVAPPKKDPSAVAGKNGSGTRTPTGSEAVKSSKKPRRPLLEGTFGPYEIEGEIARGGVGAVFRAHERDGGRIVALKVLLEDSGDSDRERFQHECETAKALSLPGMVQVYAVGEHDGRPFMAMELVAGRSLDKVIPEKTLSVNDCLVLMKSVAETIGALHEAGYVHRDLKPGNILIDAFGSPKVADFGLVKSLDEVTRLTASGLVCGTPAYMSPEQARGDGKAVDPRSDVWALGAVLYEMLCATPPFQAENALRLMLKITKDPPAPLRALNLKVPEDVCRIVMTCLEKNAERRYPNARAMAADVTRFLNGEPLEARTQPKMERLLATAGRNRRSLIAIGAGVAAVLAVAVFARTMLAPREAGPLVERGYKAKNLDEAERCFREALALDARNARARLGLGLCLARRGIDPAAHTITNRAQVAEALAETSRAAELDPKLRPECHAQAARFQLWIKQHADEARELERAVEFSGGNLKYREALALAYWNAGAQTGSPDYYRRAVREYQNILRDDPARPKVREYIKQLQERFLAQTPQRSNVSLNIRSAH